jgi:hypothetical protein
MKNLILLSTVAIVIFLMSACSKGSAGPAGPAGPSGSDSVLHSAWITLNTPLSATDSLYEEAITASSLTADILSNGVIDSYIGFPNSGDTVAISLYDPQLQALDGLISQFLFVGEIDLAATSDYSGALFRYVLIPSSALTTSAFKQYTKEQIRAMDFITVTKLLNAAKAEKSSN